MRKRIHAAVLLLALLPVHAAFAGVTNPDISVIGQPLITWTDDAGSLARKRPVFDVGETELVFDAALNPYARGFFAVALASGQAEVEEGYFSLLRGLPGDIALKGGKYRVGFGRLNTLHPHQVPFAERFGVLAAYLPGDESFNETGLDASWRLPLPGTWSVTASGDVLQGDSFRIPRAATQSPNDPLNQDPENGDASLAPRAAWVGRLAAFAPVGDRSGVELGFSATQGTNNVAAAARTRVLGGDLKAKLWTDANAYLLVQGEVLHLERDYASWESVAANYTRTRTTASGGYLFADYNWARRYNVGAALEQHQDPDAPSDDHSAVGLFAGFALMEETTVFRLDWRRLRRSGTVPFSSASFEPIQQLTLRAIFSMGPHKAHQF